MFGIIQVYFLKLRNRIVYDDDEKYIFKINSQIKNSKNIYYFFKRKKITFYIVMKTFIIFYNNKVKLVLHCL